MLDPAARAYLDQCIAAGGPPVESLPAPEARRAFLAAREANPPGQPVRHVHDLRLECNIPVRIYRSRAAGMGPSLPTLVYLHGGGWVLGNLDTVDAACRLIANAGPALVVSVDYRLAPEHKFPGPAEDCYAAAHEIARRAPEWGGDPARLAIAGDSAGANLAAAVTFMANDRKPLPIRLQVLVYPVADCNFDTASYTEFAEGFGLTRSAMQWFWNHYLPSDTDAAHPYASPLRAADLRGLPPAHIITAGYDVLRDEGLAYLRRLQNASVPATHTHHDSMIHGFLSAPHLYAQSRAALTQVAHLLAAL